MLGANGETLFARLCGAMGRPELATDVRFMGNEARVLHQDALTKLISDWTSQRSVAEVVAVLADARVPAGPIQSTLQLLSDRQLVSRKALWEVHVGGTRMVLPQLVPRLATVTERRDHPGGALGADTRAVLRELAGMTDAEVDRLMTQSGDPD